MLAFSYTELAFEKQFLSMLQENYLQFGGDNWNEIELENKIISPIIVLSQMDNKLFAYFLERELKTTIGDFELSGKVDGMIATGFRSPKKPYFCLNEYTCTERSRSERQTDPDGAPKDRHLLQC